MHSLFEKPNYLIVIGERNLNFQRTFYQTGCIIVFVLIHVMITKEIHSPNKKEQIFVISKQKRNMKMNVKMS